MRRPAVNGILALFQEAGYVLEIGSKDDTFMVANMTVLSENLCDFTYYVGGAPGSIVLLVC